jgi:hypothetical protein
MESLFPVQFFSEESTAFIFVFVLLNISNLKLTLHLITENSKWLHMSII